MNVMSRKLIWLLFAAVLSLPSFALATSPEDFKVTTTQDLIDLCATAPDDPLYAQAIHFCHGYLVGAVHYYVAWTAGPGSKRLVCFPEPRVSRTEAVKMFVDWAKAHPQYMNELPVETEFRFLTELWPCKK
jgi:hypothetical protein